MGAEKRQSRAGSLSRCSSSLLSCFNFGQESYEPISTNMSGQKKALTLQLGGSSSSSSSKALKRSSSFSRSCAGKVKEALEAAKKGSPHISELFVGGQLFLHVAPPKFGPKPHKATFSPSVGFLHMATTTTPTTTTTSMDR